MENHNKASVVAQTWRGAPQMQCGQLHRAAGEARRSEARRVASPHYNSRFPLNTIASQVCCGAQRHVSRSVHGGFKSQLQIHTSSNSQLTDNARDGVKPTWRCSKVIHTATFEAGNKALHGRKTENTAGFEWLELGTDHH